MAQLPLLPSGPLSAAVSRLTPDALPPPPDAAAMLAALLDLRGGVMLADALHALPPGGGALPTAEAAAALNVRVRDEIESLTARMDDAFVHAFRPRYRLPGPARAYTLLEQAGAFAPKRSPRVAATAARTLWAPYGDFLETHLKRARFGLRDLRREIAPRLQALGPSADRLERLESALAASTAAEIERLFRRGMHGVESKFLEGLKAALKALPKTVDEGVVQAWYAQGGFALSVFEDGQKLVQAIFAHERAGVEALVHACAAG
jgi:hypothetical protein